MLTCLLESGESVNAVDEVSNGMKCVRVWYCTVATVKYGELMVEAYHGRYRQM